MNLLHSILRAAHCRSTHHYFAIDALPMVQTDAGKRLVDVLLRYHGRYLTGAKDPDVRFRDYQNHVIHVTDGYWGGAPRVAHVWYDRLQRKLRSGKLGDAAHAAGVLSHYFTDPMMPLHTQQCEREKVLHRPIEWSITRSYDEIFRAWREDEMRVVFTLSNNVGWLGEAILHGARFANRSYAPLLDTYDLERGRVRPPDGLGLVARRSLAEVFGLAITGWARVLERAAGDAEAAMGCPIPKRSLSVGAALAAVRSPFRWWVKRVEEHREQDAIASLVSEFQRTGMLVKNLPADVDIVHRVNKVYQDEKTSRENRLSKRAAALAAEPVSRPATASAAITKPATVLAHPRSVDRNLKDRPATIPFKPRRVVAKVLGPVRPCRLSRQHTLVDAPSIGPKTAERFAAIEIHTVADFLDQSAAKIAEALMTYWITTDTVTQWQWQAKLMCEIPGLMARDCQMLAGARYDAAATIAVCEADVLHQEVSAFAATPTGRRYLRGTDPPKLADVRRWIASAIDVVGISTTRRAA
ncbi:hypothetical protein Poly51_12250 [Rubripirellula tenax]|uniref:DUF4332 domain-containing protein n=1 Tax=Rubripirellula tenax TaxID=2528015 RepID=A0A5C6FCT7_9BACT|nr:DUF4332 domain-containing protein [Rubripirellula tenax]TWU58447.1 hypothetical protein Poly51_12250 [Rubripirellula tenax]